MRLFGKDVEPQVRAYDAAVTYKLGLLARAIDRPHREASLVLHGLKPAVVPGAAGRVLDQRAARAAVVAALASSTAGRLRCRSAPTPCR